MKFADQEWPDTVYIEELQVVCDYKYFLFDWEVPVRAVVAPDEMKILTDAPDYRTRGIERDNNYLAMMRDVDNHDAKEINKEEFYRRCDEYMAHWTPERISAHEAHVEVDRKRMEESREELMKLAHAANLKAGVGHTDDRK